MEAERKLLFFDIDGTLAMPGDPVSPPVAAAIRAARSRGHLAFLSTGRAECIVPPAVLDIGFDGGIFSAGGRVVVGDQVISLHPMSEQKTREIIELLLDLPQAFFTLECEDGNFHGNVEHLKLDELDLDGGGSELRRVVLTMLESSSRRVEQYSGEPVFKISFFTPDEQGMDEVERRLSPLGKVVRFDNMLPNVSMCSGEITEPGTDKGRALLDICRHCAASPEDAIAFGDSRNDSEMLLAAGTGVAMGNAEPEVLALADRVCESCAEDGVAKELERLGLC